MAMTFLRESIGILRNVVFKNVRLSSSNVAPVDPHEGKVFRDDVEIPDRLGHAVGLERAELLAELRGDDLVMILQVVCIETGSTYEFELSLDHLVSQLNEEIYRVVRIPVDKQVLLMSGGVPLFPGKLLSHYQALLDSPVFLISRCSAHDAHGLPSPVLATCGPVDDHDLVSKMEASLHMPPTMETVQLRAMLAQHMFPLDEGELVMVEKLVFTQHIQQQGWAAVVANYEDIVSAFEKRVRVFQEQFEQFMCSRDDIYILLKRLPEMISLMHKVPLLECLKEPAARSAVTMSHHFASLDSPLDPCCSLYTWINSQDRKHKMEDVIQDVLSALQQVETWKEKVVRDVRDVSLFTKLDLKAIKGLEERLYGLDCVLSSAKSFVKNQAEMSRSIHLNHTRLLSLSDQTDILEDLCQSHSQQIREMLINHRKLKDIKKKCQDAHKELTEILLQRIDGWVMKTHHLIMDVDNKLVMYLDLLNRIRTRWQFLRQVEISPQVYAAMVVETARRRDFSCFYTKWARDVAFILRGEQEKEVHLRRSFAKKYGTHFLSKLFVGFTDVVPKFVAECPVDVDRQLPNVGMADVVRLAECVPELREHLRVTGSLQVSLPQMTTEDTDCVLCSLSSSHQTTTADQFHTQCSSSMLLFQTLSHTPTLFTSHSTLHMQSTTPTMFTSHSTPHTQSTTPTMFTSHSTLHTQSTTPTMFTSHSTLHTQYTTPTMFTSHSTLHTQSSTPTMFTSHSPLHTLSPTPTLFSSHSTLHTQSSTPTLFTSHSTLHTQSTTHTMFTSNSTLHTQSTTPTMATSHSTLQTQSTTPTMATSHSTLHTQSTTPTMATSHSTLLTQSTTPTMAISHSTLHTQSTTPTMATYHSTLHTQSTITFPITDDQSTPLPHDSFSTCPILVNTPPSTFMSLITMATSFTSPHTPSTTDLLLYSCISTNTPVSVDSTITTTPTILVSRSTTAPSLLTRSCCEIQHGDNANNHSPCLAHLASVLRRLPHEPDDEVLCLPSPAAVAEDSCLDNVFDEAAVLESEAESLDGCPVIDSHGKQCHRPHSLSAHTKTEAIGEVFSVDFSLSMNSSQGESVDNCSVKRLSQSLPCSASGTHHILLTSSHGRGVLQDFATSDFFMEDSMLAPCSGLPYEVQDSSCDQVSAALSVHPADHTVFDEGVQTESTACHTKLSMLTNSFGSTCSHVMAELSGMRTDLSMIAQYVNSLDTLRRVLFSEMELQILGASESIFKVVESKVGRGLSVELSSNERALQQLDELLRSTHQAANYLQENQRIKATKEMIENILENLDVKHLLRITSVDDEDRVDEMSEQLAVLTEKQERVMEKVAMLIGRSIECQEMDARTGEKENCVMERGADLTENQVQLKEKEIDLIENQVQLKEREIDLIEKLVDLREKQFGLKEHEFDLMGMRLSLRGNLVRLKENMAELREQKVELNAEEVKFKKIEGEFTKKLVELNEKEVEIKNMEAEFSSRQVELNEKQAELNDREIEVEVMETEFSRRQVELNEKEVEIKKREADFHTKLVELNEKQAELNDREIEVEVMETEFSRRQAELNEKEVEIKKREADFHTKLVELNEKEVDLSEKETVFNEKNAEFEKMEATCSKNRGRLREKEIELSEISDLKNKHEDIIVDLANINEQQIGVREVDKFNKKQIEMINVGANSVESSAQLTDQDRLRSDNERLHAESQLNLDQTLFGENRHLQERIRWLQVQLEHCQQQLNDVRSEPVMGNFLPAGNVSFSLVNIRATTDDTTCGVPSSNVSVMSVNEACNQVSVMSVKEVCNPVSVMSVKEACNQVSILTCNVGDLVLLCLDERHDQYVVFTVSNMLHFLHKSCLDCLALSPGKVKKNWALAEITHKEYCQTKKPNNRFKVPVNTRFYRVKAKPWTLYGLAVGPRQTSLTRAAAAEQAENR